METITFLKRETTDREGNELKTKDGRPYTRLVIKVESKGDRFISGFGNSGNTGWQVGDEVDITITESDKKDKNNQPYLNFNSPKKEDKIDAKLEQILNSLVGVRLELASINAKLATKKQAEDYPEGPNPDDVPF